MFADVRDRQERDGVVLDEVPLDSRGRPVRRTRRRVVRSPARVRPGGEDDGTQVRPAGVPVTNHSQLMRLRLGPPRWVAGLAGEVTAGWGQAGGLC